MYVILTNNVIVEDYISMTMLRYSLKFIEMGKIGIEQFQESLSQIVLLGISKNDMFEKNSKGVK